MKLRGLSHLQIAMAISVAVHGALLTLRFADPQAFNRVFQDTPLEVVLVNARTDDAPQQALAIAQANMAGGGEADRGRAASPLPPAEVSLQGTDVQPDREQMLQRMQEQQARMLSRLKSDLQAMAPTPAQVARWSPEEVERERKRRQLMDLLAEIERRIQAENARPKKRYVSPATREAAYAVYYDRLRRAIEDRGTQNFPELNGRKLYGELTMMVTVNHDGRVLETEVVQSSGLPALDRRAALIASSAGPFGPFSAAMRRQADQIAVVSRFRFTRDDTLETQVGATP